MYDFIWMLASYSTSKDGINPVNNAIDMRVGGPTYQNNINNGFVETTVEEYSSIKNRLLISKDSAKQVYEEMTVYGKKKTKDSYKNAKFIVSRTDNYSQCIKELNTVVIPALRDSLQLKNSSSFKMKLFFTGHGETYQKAGALSAHELAYLCASFFNHQGQVNLLKNEIINFVELDVCVAGLYNENYNNSHIKPFAQEFAHELQKYIYNLTRISYVKMPFGRDLRGNRIMEDLPAYTGKNNKIGCNKYGQLYLAEKTNNKIDIPHPALNKSYIYVDSKNLFYAKKLLLENEVSEDNYEHINNSMEALLDYTLMTVSEIYYSLINESISKNFVHKNDSIDNLESSIKETLLVLEHILSLDVNKTFTCINKMYKCEYFSEFSNKLEDLLIRYDSEVNKQPLKQIPLKPQINLEQQNLSLVDIKLYCIQILKDKYIYNSFHNIFSNHHYNDRAIFVLKLLENSSSVLQIMTIIENEIILLESGVYVRPELDKNCNNLYLENNQYKKNYKSSSIQQSSYYSILSQLKKYIISLY
ncbi:hypothetical protein EDC55_1058 [Allofrancisella inopinata]|uniref:Uncharacterized protein n=1 Tax=Allofrancisella inopinata TaxID=1085647 RepID=A0AAE7CRL6_9GAMM|nr:hypothetical protein [Allofrancisella inopinata]QIV95823.1 hypothetical protein E4K63_02855 [Allofrancisella inopinata]TDT72863.1 hypothetical protein EDC55_1058 [Allofrancisella inopinata]